MNREEFLRQFREALEGKVPEQVINENAAYYRNYINNQVNSGKSESETLRELGDPRLLAKTIEESSRFSSGREGTQRTYGCFYGDSYGNAADYRQETYSGDMQNANRKVTTIPAWVAALIGILIVVLVIAVVYNVFVFFLPLIVAGLAATLVYRLIRLIFK